MENAGTFETKKWAEKWTFITDHGLKFTVDTIERIGRAAGSRESIEQDTGGTLVLDWRENKAFEEI